MVTAGEVLTYNVRATACPDSGCRVYWGSHACQLRRGHDGAHDCQCCDCPSGVHPYDDGALCVSTAPYYGPETVFYGEDATVETVEDIDGTLAGHDH